MNKLIFFLKRPKIVIVKGAAQGITQDAIYQVLQAHFKMGQEVLMIDKDFEFFIKYSRLPVLVVNGDITQAPEVSLLVQALTASSYLVLNSDDDEVARDLKNKSQARVLTFGFGARADIRATAVGANFKISYQGNVVPVWLENLADQEQVYAALAASAVGEALGLNLVQVSEALRG